MILRDFSCRHCHFYIVSFKNFILFAIFSSTSSSKRAGISQAYQAQLSSVAAFTMNFGIKKEKVKADIDSLWWWSCQPARSVEGAAAAAVAAALFNFPFTLLLATLTLLVTHTVSWRVCVCWCGQQHWQQDMHVDITERYTQQQLMSFSIFAFG